jgi:hypothetical protein
LVTDANTNVTPQTAGPLNIASNGDITLAAIHLLGRIPFLMKCEVGHNPANCKNAYSYNCCLNLVELTDQQEDFQELQLVQF